MSSKLPKRLRKAGYRADVALYLEVLMDLAADRIETLERVNKEMKEIITLAIGGCEGTPIMNPDSKKDLDAIRETLEQYKDINSGK